MPQLYEHIKNKLRLCNIRKLYASHIHTFYIDIHTVLTYKQMQRYKGRCVMIFNEAEARRRRNALYIEAYARAWAEASPAERELAVLTMKERWNDADRTRHAELTRRGTPPSS
jgi:hypothetical protein